METVAFLAPCTRCLHSSARTFRGAKCSALPCPPRTTAPRRSARWHACANALDDDVTDDEAALDAAAQAEKDRRIRTEFRKDIPLLNTAVLTGRLGQDPTLMRVGRNNTELCKFSLAVQSRRTDEEGKRITSWFTVQVWGAQAARAADLLRKGLRVGVTGSIAIDEWTGKDGVGRKNVVINAKTFEVLQSRSEFGFDAPKSQNSQPNSTFVRREDGTPPFKVRHDAEDEPF